jgi:hypothetical protein
MGKFEFNCPYCDYKYEFAVKCKNCNNSLFPDLKLNPELTTSSIHGLLVRALNEYIDNHAIRTVTSDYKIGNFDNRVLVNNSIPVTITLPEPNSPLIFTGQDYTVKKISQKGTPPSSKQVTIISEAGLIDNQASLIITNQYDTYTFVSDSSNWWVV